LAAILRVWGATWRLTVQGRERCDGFRDESSGSSLIFAFPHNRLSMLAYCHRDRPLQILNSSSRDGLLMASMCEALGMDSVLGSSSRGGSAALRELARRGRKGLDLGITVDGPRGPRGRVKAGVVALAFLTGSPVIPVSASARPRKIVSSWDRSLLPWPGAKVTVRFGPAMRLDPSADARAREAFRIEIESTLQKLSDQVDRDLGNHPIAPALEEHG